LYGKFGGVKTEKRNESEREARLSLWQPLTLDG
jgi:hypothetical protein